MSPLLGAALTLLIASAAHASAPLVFAIQPLGRVDACIVSAAARRLAGTYAARVVVLPRRPVPADAWYAPRGRYRGERLLADLDTRTPADVAKVVGILAEDVSVSTAFARDWGVLGVADPGRRAAVVSVHRMRRRGASEALVERRAGRVAAHELGHALGLPHCDRPGCLMNDAGGTIRTVDRSSGEFCAECRRRLGGALRTAGQARSALAARSRLSAPRAAARS